jgi:hypothetical protein
MSPENTSGDAATSTAKPSRSYSFSAMSLFLLAVLAAILVMGWFLNKRLTALEIAQPSTPPMVVVDFVELAKHYPQGASAEEVESLMAKTNEAIIKLQQAGYLVLDGQAVMVAPDNMYLPAEVLMETARSVGEGTPLKAGE